jgi:large subunit ribosomal protein L17
MRHNNSGKRLGRNTSQRLAMMRNLVTSLIQHERITTTDTKAKELRKLADKMVTLGKKNSLHARRQALRIVRDRAAVGRLFDLLAPRYHNRPGGYTRIIKLCNRQGDNAPISRIEFVEELDPGKIKVRKTPEAEGQEEPPVAEETTAAESAPEGEGKDAAERLASEESGEGVEDTENAAGTAAETDEAVASEKKEGQ